MPSAYVGVVEAYRDAVSAAEDNRIVGFAKAGPSIQLDSSMLELEASTTIRLLSMSDAQVKKALEFAPDSVKVNGKNEQITALPNYPLVQTWASLTSGFTTTEFQEELVYKSMKTVYKKWKPKIVSSFLSAGEVDVYADTVNYSSQNRVARTWKILQSFLTGSPGTVFLSASINDFWGVRKNPPHHSSSIFHLGIILIDPQWQTGILGFVLIGAGLLFITFRGSHCLQTIESR